MPLVEFYKCFHIRIESPIAQGMSSRKEYITWNEYFKVIMIFGQIDPEVALKLIFILLHCDYNREYNAEQIAEIVSCVSLLNNVVEQPSFQKHVIYDLNNDGYLTFKQLALFFYETPLCFSEILEIQEMIYENIMPLYKFYEISQRKGIRDYISSYKLEHEGEKPREGLLSRICNTITHSKSKYDLDYFCEEIDEDLLLNMVMKSLHYSFDYVENKSISILKRTGSVYTSSLNNTPISKINSRSLNSSTSIHVKSREQLACVASLPRTKMSLNQL